MIRYIGIRIVTGIVLVWVTMTLIFLMLQAVPGDPAVQILGGGNTEISPEALAAVRESLGLDRPVWVQYFAFLGSVFTGNFGESYVYAQPVVDLIGPRLQVTLEIAIFALILGTIVGVALGAWAARSKGAIDTIVSGFLSVLTSVPVYVVGALFVLLFALTWHLLPSGGFTSIASNPGTHFARLILPVVALSLPIAAVVGRMTRSQVMENLEQDWVRTARSWGQTRAGVFNKHVLRNSLTSVAAIVGLEAGSLIGSTVLVERIFNLPGVGSLLIDSVTARDYPVVQSIVVVLCICFIILSLVVEIVYGLLDPRIRRAAL
ncbi:ABC transporter permease [Brevibacterium moorei]|uniref:ABC transporter permease n=1 Tax=Brevibacterium moorei TaxID=2968457 RepID=UPI00211BEC79|nr:ABC transporter permease [Brevibacterium sp. 68QC2CO]MCQ9386606.1 ABC transporter permease [Brevibacterium sp. 68QC2CO]